MADTKLKSADHKKIITDLMLSLTNKLQKSWIVQFYQDQEAIDPSAETMVDLASYTNTKCWKRTRKYTELDDNGRIVIFRDFAHVSELGIVTIAERIDDNGEIHLEIEMENMPEPFKKALDIVDEFDVPSLAGPVGKKFLDPKQPKQSMLDTPKPEGFGAFS